MGVIVMTDTTDIPITQIGEYAGECWGADTRDHEKNYKRGLDCIKCNHGRTLEFPQVYLKISGYSARVIRELYTHIGGSPTRLQASTRYINYSNFEYITPPSLQGPALELYQKTMKNIANAATELKETYGIPKEDAALLLPLGMESTIVIRTNLRNLIDMSHQRLCTRANWEFRKLMREIIDALDFYSDEWKVLIRDLNVFVPKCKILGYCPESRSCASKLTPHSAKDRDFLIDFATEAILSLDELAVGNLDFDDFYEHLSELRKKAPIKSQYEDDEK